MITRERAQELVDKYVTTPWLKLHMRESELIMRAVAKKLGENEDEWGIAGLLHDLDFDYVEKDPQRHVVELDEILKKESITVGEDISNEMYHAIKAHYESHPEIHEKRESKFDYALSASENLSGFLVACTLVMPDKKISSLQVDSVIKKLKKKDFAKAVNREYIYDIEKAGISLDEFIGLSITSLKEVSEELGL